MKSILSLLLAITFHYTISTAQNIPNTGFENWTNMGSYFEPDGWGTLNSLTNTFSVYTVTRGNPGNPGSYHIKITSKTAGSLGIVPGMAVSGILNNVSMAPASGFAFNQRPAHLTGQWQHMIFGNSQGSIDATLTRWDGNQRIVVAVAHHELVGMAMNWANFSIPFNYLDGNNPDTCIITLLASGSQPTNGDYLWVDALAFSGTVTGLEDLSKELNFNIHPNPIVDKLTFLIPCETGKISKLSIRDVNGRVLKNFPDQPCNEKIEILIADLPRGTYLLTANFNDHFTGRKFTKE